jgi:hypothetical protein
MSNIIEWKSAITKKIIPEGEYENLDRLGKIDLFFSTIKKKYNLGVLIQSDVTYRRDVNEYHCMIGYSLTEEMVAVTVANGLGDTMEKAIINSINNFIEYYNINRDLLKE